MLSRTDLLREVARLSRRILFGTLSETYRTCGSEGCRCHRGEKHGPHLYVSFRGREGKTTGFYVPKALEDEMREGAQAWGRLEEVLRELAERNRQRLWASRARRSKGGKDGSSKVSSAKRL
jgi:hypothetical protein